jgi:DNA-binding response OmpR family regulator
MLEGMKPKVLLVDDDPEFTELIAYNLKQRGWEILSAHTGLQGLRLARAGLPDVILLDVMLPDLDGLSVCQILNSQPSTNDVPVFIVSALDETWAGTRKSRARFSRFFRKPVSMALLADRVQDAFTERQSEIQNRLQEDKYAR